MIFGSKKEKPFTTLLMKLLARPQDTLDWQIEGIPSVFEFELGLAEPYFPLDDELHFQSLAAALTHFTKEVWPRFPDSKAILYRGKADFSPFFKWSEAQEKNYQTWKQQRPEGRETHLKRLFCAEAFVNYFQMLAHRLPDELPLTLIVDPADTGTLAETLHLLSPERFEHFHLESGLHYDANIGVCFPPDEACTVEVLQELEGLMKKLPHFRPVYETLLTEQWDGLDEIYVVKVTEQGKRKMLGFEAAGGKIRGRGI